MEKKKAGEAIGKSSALYVVLMVLWAGLTALLWWNFARSVGLMLQDGVVAKDVVAILLLVLNTLFIGYFWLNGAKDLIYVLWYYIGKRRLEKGYERVMQVDVSNATERVLMVYCTCNDFDGASLEKCLRQRYENAVTVILDDSTQESYKMAVDEFAEKHGIEVVRRADRRGFKAGNINHYLRTQAVREGGFEYFVILDADEVIPEDFIYQCLKYFRYYTNVGIVQAGHVAVNNRNFFMKLFHVGVNSHWNTYQTMKHCYGFSSLLGHGAMVSMQCYEESGGFPELVAEDLCLSIEARERGYVVAYAPNIVCHEEYPVDYTAFKKRHSKWTQGNMEFIKNYTGKIACSKMKWYEKLDIVLFTYNLPLTAVFALFILLNVALFPLLKIELSYIYPVWMLIPTIIFFLSPMLNDVFFWTGRLSFFRNILYFVCVFLLYGSMFFITFASSLLGLFGKKAVFVVTPKNSQKTSLWQAIKLQRGEFIFSTVLIIVSVACALLGGGGVLQGISSVALISFTGYLSVFLPLFSNLQYDEEKMRKIDAQTTQISINMNKLLSNVAEQGKEVDVQTVGGEDAVAIATTQKESAKELEVQTGEGV